LPVARFANNGSATMLPSPCGAPLPILEKYAAMRLESVLPISSPELSDALNQTIVLTSVTSDAPVLYIPPPRKAEVLSEIVQFDSFGEQSSLFMPPP